MSPKSPSAQFGAHLAELRTQRGLTQSQLADVLGVSSSEVISRWERGEREPRLEMLAAIARALDASPGTLLDPVCSAEPASANGPHGASAAEGKALAGADWAGVLRRTLRSRAHGDELTFDARSTQLTSLIVRLQAADPAHAAAACRLAAAILDEMEALGANPPEPRRR